MSIRPTKLIGSIRAGVHGLVARICYRLGSYASARRHFERVIELRGDDFTAYVYLGRVAYKTGDYAGWRRECARAQRTSPERYARLEHSFELVEPRAAGSPFETGERTQWRSLRPSPVASARDNPTAAGNTTAEPAASTAFDACPGGPVRRYGDDFSSDAERTRFSGFDPIAIDDVRSADLDSLVRDLTRRAGA